MFDLPWSLTRYFRDASGRLDHRALLRTPDRTLVAIAQQMDQAERVGLYQRLRSLRLGWLHTTMAQAAGIDAEAQRGRFLRILVEAERVAQTMVSDQGNGMEFQAAVCGASTT